MFVTKMFQLVEIVVNTNIVSANAQIYIPNQPQLQSVTGDRQIWVKGIQAFSSQAIPVSPLTTANQVANAAAIKNATLTLVVRGAETLKQMPLTMFNSVFAEAGANFVPYQWQMLLLKNIFEVDWSKSYITCVAAPVFPGGNPFSYLLGVHYDYEASSVN